MEKVLFKEEQRYHQWWIWIILGGSFTVSVVPLWYGLYKQVSTGVPWGNNPAGNGELAVIAIGITLLMTALILIFFMSRLIVEIRDNGLFLKYPPLIRKWRKISPEEIDRFTVGKYNPVTEYGGWGVRRSYGKFGRAYNVSGNIGLRLYLKNRKIITIGTKRAQAIAYAMDKMMSGKDPVL